MLHAVVFLIPYSFTRSYALLIPGCILAGIGIGLVWERGTRSEITLPIGLGLGFLSVFFVQLVVARVSHWWLLIPEGILVVLGMQDALQAQPLVEKGRPLALSLIGLLILVRASSRFRPETKG